VAGLPDPDPHPARTLLKSGLGLVADTKGHPAGWRVRVGVHVGPVVSGLLGRTQVGFDVWGHTVNVAARVEAHGTPGRVTLSDAATLSPASRRCIRASALASAGTSPPAPLNRMTKKNRPKSFFGPSTSSASFCTYARCRLRLTTLDSLAFRSANTLSDSARNTS